MATVKHTAPPATAEEIQRAVGVTKEDRKIVDRVLVELGYISGRREATAGKFLGTKVGKTAAAKPTPKKGTGKKPTPQKSK